MANIPKARTVCTVSVMFVQKDDGEYATVLTEDGVRPFEADIVLAQAARHITSHIEDMRDVREIQRSRVRHRRYSGVRWSH